jgi:hypothetical protein
MYHINKQYMVQLRISNSRALPVFHSSAAHAQVLLTVGAKYDMPALLSKAGQFLQANAAALNGKASSRQFAWKWITLADTSGLPEVAMACIDAKIGDLSTLDEMVGDCKQQLLLGLSPPVCCHLAKALAWQLVFRQRNQVKMSGSGSACCDRCMATTHFVTRRGSVVCCNCNNSLR